ncbi:hypothetical protein QFZ72_003253 [Bacillus sp. V2I10]|nr:hypothetical protein [Bacillus sp. V2I10]
MDSLITPLDLLVVVGFVNVGGFAVVAQEMTFTHMIMIATTRFKLMKGVGDSLSNSFILYDFKCLIYN